MSAPCEITAGPDGNLWFTECNINGNSIGRITPSGVITEFPLPTSGRGYYPLAIAPGPDSNIWFTEPCVNRIGRITPAGLVAEFPLPTGSSDPARDHRRPRRKPLVYGRAEPIGRITTEGVIAEFSIPTGGSGPAGSPPGRDGNLWFTERAGNEIGRITTAGVVTEFAVPTTENGPFGITAGPKGNIWFTEIAIGSQIGRIGLIRSGAMDLTIGPDNTIRVLRLGGGQMAVDSVDNAQAISPGSRYGPYPGWTGARSIAAGDDSLTRVLWTNDDGTTALWLVGPEGNGASPPPARGRGMVGDRCRRFSRGSDPVLWTDADGRTALWSIDNAGNVSAGEPLGPYRVGPPPRSRTARTACPGCSGTGLKGSAALSLIRA